MARDIWKLRNGLLFIDFVVSFSFFMFIPYLSTNLSELRGFSASFIGLVLAIRIAAQQGLAIWGGLLADQLGYKTMAITGFIIRGLGFIGMGYASNEIAILASGALAGLGGAFFSPALRATIAYYSRPKEQKGTYALMNIAENVGAVLGPMFGVIFYKVQFDILSLITGGLFFIIGLVYIRIPDTPVHQHESTWIGQISYILKDKRFMPVFFGMIPFYFIYQQLFLSIPMIAQKYTGSSNWIFPVVTILIVLFQIPLIQIIESKSIWYIISISYLFAAVLFIPLSISTNLISILLCLIGISIATMMLLPSYQTLSVSTAPSNLVAGYLGFSNISMAIGGTLGNLMGGALLDFFSSINQENLFWLFLMILSLLPIIVLKVVKIKYIIHINEKV